MLSGKELILATKPFAKEDRRKSWWYTLSTLGLCILTLTGTVLLPWLGARIACSIIAGLSLVRMFVIYHDHQHHTILHKSAMGDAIMTVFGIYTITTINTIPNYSAPVLAHFLLLPGRNT
jgi:acyl-lipid omega-6 desaturase (Delta-12 desaturase)